MKKFLILTLMLLTVLSASAKVVSAARDSQGVKFGVRGSLALSTMNQEEDIVVASWDEWSDVSLKPLSALALGFAWNIPVLESFHFNIELKYEIKGDKIIAKEDFSKKVHRWNRIGYWEVPIQPQLRLKISEKTHLNVNFGPYIAVAMLGKAKEKTHVATRKDYTIKLDMFSGRYYEKTEGEKREWSNAKDDFEPWFSRLDVGLALGVDYQIENFHVGVSYDLGLKDINAFARDQKDDAGYTPIKNRTALFTLGFDF